MSAKGVVLVRADRLSAAVQQVEELGCAVVLARPVNDAEFACDVLMPRGAAAAVAHAVAKRQVVFSPS